MTQGEIIAVAITTLIGLIITGVFKYLFNKLKITAIETLAVKSGVQALLRDRLYQMYHCCNRKGCATIDDRENFENMYTKYHALGNNGVMDELRHKFLKLPTEKEKVNNEELG